MEQELKDLACVETSETKDSKKRWQSPQLTDIDYRSTGAGEQSDQDLGGFGGS